jgi:predicted nucleotidyltransferase
MVMPPFYNRVDGTSPSSSAGSGPEARVGLRDLYGERFRRLLLYGSYARGDAREGSDVDLLLVLSGPVNPAREILHLQDVKWPLALEYDAVLSVLPVSAEAFERAETLFLKTVLKDAVRAA